MIIKNNSEAEIKFPLTGGKELVILPDAVVELDQETGKKILRTYGFCEEYIEQKELAKVEDYEGVKLNELKDEYNELFGKNPKIMKNEELIQIIVDEKNKSVQTNKSGMLTVTEATQVDFKDEEIPDELTQCVMGERSYCIIGQCYVPYEYAEILFLDKKIRLFQAAIVQLKEKLKI